MLVKYILLIKVLQLFLHEHFLIVSAYLKQADELLDIDFLKKVINTPKVLNLQLHDIVTTGAVGNMLYVELML